MTVREQEVNWQEMRDKAVRESVREKLRAKTPGQAAYLAAIEKSAVTLCAGPAGTGKTWLACGYAAKALREGRVKRVVFTRPLVTCSGKRGQGPGFLPGDLDEKCSPHMRPMLEAFGDFYSPEEVAKLMEARVVEMWPLDYMRGASIKDSLVVCDESQNAEFEQLYMLLTRIDRGTKLVVVGDDSRRQTDLRVSGEPPFAEVFRRLAGRRPEVSGVRLGREDVVRHPLVSWLDERLSTDENEPEADWASFPCRGCGAAAWFEDDGKVEQAACHACGAVHDLWDGDELDAVLVPIRRPGCAETLRRKP